MSGPMGAGPKNARTREWPATKKLQQEDGIAVQRDQVQWPVETGAGPSTD